MRLDASLPSSTDKRKGTSHLECVQVSARSLLASNCIDSSSKPDHASFRVVEITSGAWLETFCCRGNWNITAGPILARLIRTVPCLDMSICDVKQTLQPRWLKIKLLHLANFFPWTCRQLINWKPPRHWPLDTAYIHVLVLNIIKVFVTALPQNMDAQDFMGFRLDRERVLLESRWIYIDVPVYH